MIARAVAPLNILIELCVPFVKVGGTFIALKGAKSDEELDLAKSAIKKLDLEVVSINEEDRARLRWTSRKGHSRSRLRGNP